MKKLLSGSALGILCLVVTHLMERSRGPQNAPVCNRISIEMQALGEMVIQINHPAAKFVGALLQMGGTALQVCFDIDNEKHTEVIVLTEEQKRRFLEGSKWFCQGREIFINQSLLPKRLLAVPEIANADKNKDDVAARERAVAAQARERAENEKRNADRERARADRERARADIAEKSKEAAYRALAEASQKRQLENQIRMEKEDKEAEEAVASRKLKFAKQLRTASMIEENKGNVRESQRLLGCYITELDLIIEKYPKTTSAEEARVLYGYGDTASNSR